MVAAMQSGVAEGLLHLRRRLRRLQHHHQRPLQDIQEHVTQNMAARLALLVVTLAMQIAIAVFATPNLGACPKISASECATAATMQNGAVLHQHHLRQHPQLHHLHLQLYGQQLATSCSAMEKMLCCMGSEPLALSTWHVVSA